MSALVIRPDRLICDCCAAPDPKYDYDTQEEIVVRGLRLGESGYAAPELRLERYWVVCRICADFIDREDWNGLTEYVLAIWFRQRPPANEGDEDYRRRSQRAFFAAVAQQGMTRCFYCEVCRMVSYNPDDIEERYCGNCHEFR